MKILIIEDDKNMVDYMTHVIKLGFADSEIISTHLGRRGIELASEHTPTVTIVDIGLPDISGFDVIQGIRRITNNPIIILSAHSTELDVVKGLNLGANDYIIKPFRHLEFLARLKTVMQSSALLTPNTGTSYGDVHFGRSISELCVGDKTIKLTYTEGRIMNALIGAKGDTVSLTQLAQIIWGTDAASGTDGIKVYIYRLRHKVEKNGLHIVNVPALGYYLAFE